MSTGTTTCSHLSRAKSAASLIDKMKQEQSKLEEQLAIDYINKTLNLSIQPGELQKELKDGVVLCK
ncbi:hypothetical protein RMCBS344292_16795 [Rhizopus microsporus]|nr:hypothetical protein RMCBS344292_03656 [Rhizopus microsporus]CEJ02800.1 hypothetical protein RMCBS344292_16795 [Rhizopus microsporus]